MGYKIQVVEDHFETLIEVPNVTRIISSSKAVDKDKTGRCFQCHPLGNQVKDCPEL